MSGDDSPRTPGESPDEESEEDFESEKNEYELMRAAKMAQNKIRLQPLEDAANALNSELGLARRKSKKQVPRGQTSLPQRRSDRLKPQSAKAVEDHGGRVRGTDEPRRGQQRCVTADEDVGPDGNSGGSPSSPFAGTGPNVESQVGRHSLKRNVNLNQSGGSPSPATQERFRNDENRSPLPNSNDSPDKYPTFCSSSRNPFEAPTGYTWVPVPNYQVGANVHNVLSGYPPPTLPQEWRSSHVNVVPSFMSPQGRVQDNVYDNVPLRSSSIKEESLKKRIRRAKKKEIDEEAKRRVTTGKQPYAVQVRPDGTVDSGCVGHLKWQEFVRDLTPRMLDVSIIRYEDQDQSSRDKLLETMKVKFEFLEHQVTQLSFERMIKTWLRRERERVKRLHGQDAKAPAKFNDTQWDSLKKYWDSSAYKEKSEKMTETRKKVVNQSRVGRHGYAGKQARLVEGCETSPRVREMRKEILDSRDNPVGEEMEKKNAVRLSAMERNQVETNRRLEDVMKSITNLESMIQSSMSSSPNTDNRKGKQLNQSHTTTFKDASGDEEYAQLRREDDARAPGSSEKYWDKMLLSSEDDDSGGDIPRKSRVDEFSVKEKDPDLNKSRSAATTDKGLSQSKVTYNPDSTMRKSLEVEASNQNPSKANDIALEQILPGNRVWLGDTLDPSVRVGSGTVLNIGGGGMFHNRLIPPNYVRVNLEEVIVDLPLMIPVEQADQATLKDALGSSVLWFKGLVFLRK